MFVIVMRWTRYALALDVDYAKFFSRSHDAVIRVYDAADNVIETHEHAGDFRISGSGEFTFSSRPASAPGNFVAG